MNRQFNLGDDAEVVGNDKKEQHGLENGFVNGLIGDVTGSGFLDSILPDFIPPLPASPSLAGGSTNSSSRISTRRRAAASAAISALGRGESPVNGVEFKNGLYRVPAPLTATGSNGFSTSNSTVTTLTLTSNSAGPSTMIPGFISKLFKMLSDPTISSMISWSPDGSSFVVLNPEDFSRLVLPHFFKHNNFSSFVRQLNMYGFHKVPHLQQGSIAAATAAAMDSTLPSLVTSSMWEFAHPSFLRDRPDLLASIRRKISRDDNVAPDPVDTAQGKTSGAPAKTSGPQEVFPMTTSVDVMRTVDSLRQELTALRQQQTALLSDLQSIHRDNQLLWSENLASRERHAQQQQVIDRILRFLASVFSSAGADSRLTGAAAHLISGLASSQPPSTGSAVASTLGPMSRSKRPLMLLEEGTSFTTPDSTQNSSKVAKNIGDVDFQRQVLDLIESNNQTQQPSLSLEESPKSQHSRRLVDLQSTTHDIAHDISLVDDEIDSLTGQMGSAQYSKEDDFDFSNYLNVQSLE